MKLVMAFVVALLTFMPAVLHAEALKLLSIRSNETRSIALNRDTKQLILLARSKGNLTVPIELQATVPEGAVVKASAALLQGSVENLLQDEKRFWPLSLKDIQKISEEHRSCLEVGLELGDLDPSQKLTPEMFPPVSSPICDLYSAADKENVRLQLQSTFGGEWSEGNVCGYLVSVSNAPDLSGKEEWCKLYDWELLLGLGVNCYPDRLFAVTKRVGAFSAEYIHSYGVLRKDACAGKRSEYLIRIEIDLSRVNAELKDKFLTTIRYRELKYSGGMRASLKPESEGRFAPLPIVLMEWLGGTCGNAVTMTKWLRGRPVSTTKLNLYSFLIYRPDLTLGLALVDKVLKGGEGTFEISDGFQAYGVCMRLERRRQRVNGYR